MADLEEKYTKLNTELKEMKKKTKDSECKRCEQNVVKTVQTSEPIQMNNTKDTNLAVKGQTEPSI